LLWKPNTWKVKRFITTRILLQVSRTNAKTLLVKKLHDLDPEDEEDNEQPPEIVALARLPDCPTATEWSSRFPTTTQTPIRIMVPLFSNTTCWAIFSSGRDNSSIARTRSQ
jgi:hypothetical protein